jgi:serine phosphatase RsbU (regulator of sigma subunit)
MSSPPSPITLSPQELDLFRNSPDVKYLPAGEVLITEGEPGREMYILLDGVIDISAKGRPLDRLYAGTVLGEMAMIDDQPRSATATTAIDCCVLAIDRTRFRELVQQYPALATRVMSIMSHRLRRLVDEEVKRQRLEEELAVGRRIQLSLVPSTCPVISGYECVAYYSAARQVGGDLYDFITNPERPDELTIAIADVTGKGIPAALYMAVSRTIIRAEAGQDISPAEALQRVNRFIVQDRQSPLFLSAFLTRIHTPSGDFTCANAGHNAPFWYHAATGRATELSVRGLLLGAFGELRPQQEQYSLAPGDCLILFTDGITEARNAAGDFFDEERLQAIIESSHWSTAEELLDAIVNSVAAFAGDEPPADDMTLIVLRRRPLDSD